ncbi:MAG TPA: 5'/3'-nucleotidase SurE [Phycisphaerae bacterium]|mgnify:FL=1|nr:5'/3'-nucleotidase SurE [Phycisphaerae bacterium]
MRILLTNDDGIMAPGLLALRAELATRGDVTVVAPATPQSAVGHAISVSQPLFCQEIDLADGVRGFSVDGRPADCVKLALLVLMKDRKPDLVVSGINHGANVGINVLYSGTVAAAIEGAFYGVPSVAASLAFSQSMHFREAARLVCRVVDQAVARPRGDKSMLLNVNVPDLSQREPRGLRVCRMSIPPSREEMIRRADPRGRPYFWITGGEVPAGPADPESDQVSLADGYVTVTPLQFDLTDVARLKAVAAWNLSLSE